MRQFLIIIILLNLLCCSSPGSKNGIIQNSNPNITTISVFQPVPIDVKTIITEIGFIKLDTAIEATVTPSELRVYKNRIYIRDGRTESVLMFDRSGRFIKKIGMIGRGPKEFLSMRSIEIDYFRDRLYITDAFGSKTMAFDLDGNYLFTVPLGDAGGLIAITPSGIIIHEGQMSTFGIDQKTMTQKENIKIIDTMGNLITKGFEYNYNRKINSFFNTISVSKSGEITFAPLFRDTIYSITDSAITPLYAFDFSKVKGITKKRSDTYNSYRDFDIDKRNGYVCLQGKHINSPDFFYTQLSSMWDKSHLFYNKATKETHIIKLWNYTYEDGYLFTKNITLFNGVSSALIPFNISDYCDGYFYGTFNEGQLSILEQSNPQAGTIERLLLDNMDSNGSNTFVTYLKF